MYNPAVYETDKTQELISAFGGLNCNPVIPDNCFSDECNMGGVDYPLISPRNKRAFFDVYSSRLHGLFSKSKIMYINNGLLYYGGEAVEGLIFPDIQGERQFVSMGARVLVFPDKVYFNTADFSDYGSLEAYFFTEEGINVTCSLSKGDGDLYEDYFIV